MNFHQLQYIVTVADCKSVTKAAEQLYMSQPALSHFIRKTEEEVGMPLFDRSTNPISMTYAGEVYVENAREILMRNKAAEKKLRDISENRSGSIRIGIPRDRESYMFPVLLREFIKKYPGIRVKTMTSGNAELTELLKKGRIDFMLLAFYENDPMLKEYRIYEEELLLAARKGMIRREHLASGSRRTVDLKKLEDMPFLLLPKGRGGRAAAEELFKQYKMKPVVQEEYDSNITSFRMAEAGFGVTIIPRMTTELIKCSDAVDIYRIGDPPVKWEIKAVFRKDAYMGKAERDLLELAGKLFKKR